MVLPTATARSFTCLRCQLRKSLLRTRSRDEALVLPHQPCYSRPFSIRPLLRRDFTQEFAERSERTYRWNHVETDGIIVGRPGKRQRVVSKPLSRDSLGKRSEVLVFSDVKEEPEETSALTTTWSLDGSGLPRNLSAKDIENVITGRHQAPKEVEVNASLDALRPKGTVLKKPDFDALKQSLLNGYTFKQLSRYLIASIIRPATMATKAPRCKYNRAQELGGFQWQLGKTPLSQRHTPQNDRSAKVVVAEQILRLAWLVVISSEKHEVGEIEFRLQFWQQSLLFGLMDNGRPYYASLIPSPALLEAVRIEAYRPQTVMRITGHRQDAEEAARQIQLAIAGVQRADVDVSPLLPDLARAGREWASLFRIEDLRYVSEATKCVIIAEDQGIVAIYGTKASRRRTARRLILSLLEFPPPASYNRWVEVSREGAQDLPSRPRANPSMPVGIVAGLHRRHHGLDLARISKTSTPDADSQPEHLEVATTTAKGNVQSAQPSIRKGTHRVASHLSEAANYIAVQLNQASNLMPGMNHREGHTGSCWRDEVHVSDWEAEYCKLLQKTTDAVESGSLNVQGVSPAVQRDTRAVQNIVPGVSTLLSYFRSSELPRSPNPMTTATREHTFDRRKPYLNAHFIPSAWPENTSLRLPRLQMQFRISTPTRSGQLQEMDLVGIKAVLDEQHLHVALPEHAVDLRFKRQASIVPKLDVALKDKAIHNFKLQLQESVSVGKGALDAPSELTMRLPSRIVHGQEDTDTPANKDIEVRFALERFEQVQRIKFRTQHSELSGENVDAEVKGVLDEFLGGFHLHYEEVDGGAVHGNRTLLRLRARPVASVSASLGRVKEDDQEQNTMHLLGAGSQHVLPAVYSAPGKAAGDESGMQAAQSLGKLSDSSSLTLATLALRFANLLTRATAGTLRRMGESEE